MMSVGVDVAERLTAASQPHGDPPSEAASNRVDTPRTRRILGACLDMQLGPARRAEAALPDRSSQPQPASAEGRTRRPIRRRSPRVCGDGHQRSGRWSRRSKTTDGERRGCAWSMGLLRQSGARAAKAMPFFEGPSPSRQFRARTQARPRRKCSSSSGGRPWLDRAAANIAKARPLNADLRRS